MELQVTREAARRIRQRGGQLFLWQEAVGASWATDEIDFRRPEDVEFRTQYDAGVEILIARGITARLVRVAARWWPARGVKVYVDGKRWGRRGRVSGQTGLDLGGAGPG